MSIKSREEIIITVASSQEEKTNAIIFIETNMRKSFGCEPPPTTGVIFTARLSGEIVGSIVLQGTEKNVPFPVENYYEFNPPNSTLSFSRARTVQGSRWLAIRPNVSFELLRTSASLACEFGKQSMLIEAKPYSVKRLTELGIHCRKIPNANLQQEKVRIVVGESGMRYFTELPLPTLYVIDLKQVLSI